MDDNKNLASAEPDTKQAQSQGQSRGKEQYETNFDVDGTIETETKSISSNKSAGSNQEIRYFPQHLSLSISFSPS